MPPKHRKAASSAVDRHPVGRERRVRTRFLDPSSRLRARRGVSRWLFVAPTLVLLIIFVFSPLVMAIGLSVFQWSGIGEPTFVGARNFQILVRSEDFHRILLNNTFLLLGLAIWVTLPLLVAVMLQGLRGASLFRAAFLIPLVLPPVVIGRAFRLLLTDDGLLNETLRGLGLDVLAFGWLTDDRLVNISVIWMIAWATFGMGVLFYSAGLAAISTEMVDAARVDGAAWGQLLRHIYAPSLAPVTGFLVLLLTVSTMTAFFPWIFGLTRGGPGVASTTLDYQVYQSGIRGGRYGVASAIAVVVLVYLAILLLVQFFVFRRRAAR
jgi:ABC-type sugar transport system permease subunit